MLSFEMHGQLLREIENSSSKALPDNYPLQSLFGDIYKQQEKLLGIPNKDRYKQEENSTEIERVYYVKITDLDVLEHASKKEHQEQWEYRLFNNNKPIGTLRSRMVEMGERYELTIKSYRKEGVGSNECTLVGNDAMHKQVQEISNRGLKKIRYYFPVETNYKGEVLRLVWEVDVYYNKEGEINPWVKIDLEVPNPDIKAPPIPFAYMEAIDASFDRKLSDEDRKIVDDFFDQIKIETN